MNAIKFIPVISNALEVALSNQSRELTA